MSATYRLRDVASGTVVADRIRPAHTHWTRLRGLLGTAPLTMREGLWLAVGHEGLGVTTATGTAALLAAMMTGRRVPFDPAPCAAQRFAPVAAA